ncbi:hypothetical protein Cni_G12743 [Canna indica]|uniref:Transmembrane protein n=1 Tax=Canna indica TaxID=4628 RepID=A0AAQ3KCM1_9LILI|nr:hypothetical protein Cni_G12743 [Canna indica]
MDKNSSGERDLVFDLESGMNSVTNEQEGVKEKRELSRVWSGFVGIDGSIKGERAFKLENSTSISSKLPLANKEALVDERIEQDEKVGLLEQKIGVKKSKKKGCKKPPKPPRPPNSLPLDAADHELMKQIEEIEMLRRARIDRMKKKLKNANSAHSSSSLWALIITILFVFILIWPGVYSRRSYSINFHGSPKSSVHTRGGLISIQFHKNGSRNATRSSSSASPKYAPSYLRCLSIHP